jgi:signal transduction histidine kinase
MSAPPPLAQGNRLQRAYARWAAPRYARLPPEAREPAELMDRYLYSRRGLGVWLGITASTAGTTLGLQHTGMPAGSALLLALIVWVGLPLSLLAAWLTPSHFSSHRLWRKLPLSVALALAGGVLGFTVSRIQRHGALDVPRLAQDLWQHAAALVPAVLLGAATLVFLLWGVAGARRQALERALERERLAHERDLQAHRAAEARLQLLQAQIQPHFIFNTLAALQHWVDSGDARAGPLLRMLTAFLRGSTDLLGSERTTLAAEAAVVQQYLQIMQARLGGRLRFELQIDPDCAAFALPPGLLLTLVENAVEHGVAPALAGGTVQVRAQRCGTGVQVQVRDDGAGLPADWQAGTGLANCRARLLHFGDGSGRISLQPLALGTEVLLTLPATAACTPTPAAVHAAGTALPARPGTGTP